MRYSSIYPLVAKCLCQEWCGIMTSLLFDWPVLFLLGHRIKKLDINIIQITICRIILFYCNRLESERSKGLHWLLSQETTDDQRHYEDHQLFDSLQKYNLLYDRSFTKMYWLHTYQLIKILIGLLNLTIFVSFACSLQYNNLYWIPNMFW